MNWKLLIYQGGLLCLTRCGAEGFRKSLQKFVEEFGAVIKVETRLCPYDIQGSLAHVTMLGETGIIAQEDVEKIKAGLHQVVGQEIKDREVPIQC